MEKNRKGIIPGDYITGGYGKTENRKGIEFMIETIKVKRLHPKAVIPKRATEGSAGYDLCACLEQDQVILPGETVLIGTGIAIAIPHREWAAFIYARSGLASKHSIAPANCVGVVDSDYRGELRVPLKNSGQAAFTVHPGDRIAQMVLAPVYLPELEEADELDETLRGTGGFGSSGISAQKEES